MKFEIETNRSRKKQQQRYKQKIYLLIICFLVVSFLILLITYLILESGNKKKQQMPTSTPKVIEKNEKEEETEIKLYNEDSNDRPIAFIIDNAITDVNYAGLQSSFLNYEILTEDGHTKIMSIYKDRNVNLIGPIQSINNYFLDYALESDAIIAYYGSTQQSEKEIKDLNVNNINGRVNKEPFRRDAKSKSPHNVFTNIEYVKDYLSSTEVSTTSNTWKLLNLSKVEVKLENDKSAKKITIPYSTDEYRSYMYDETNKYYLRSQNGSAHIDRQTNKQLHYKNILIIKVETKKSENEEKNELKTTGTGTGYYITNGKYDEISWSKETRNSKSVYKYKDGSEVKLNDGNTFIQIIPTENNVTIE